MKKKTLKQSLSLILVGVLFAAMTLTMGCGDKKTSTETSVETSTEVSETTSVETSTEASVEASTETSEETSSETSTEEVSAEVTYPASGETLGEGETQFTFVCIDADGNEINYTINTNATVVADALLENNLVEGDDSEWGLYVKKVCGITADYDVDQTYWAFYIDGEYAMTGVSATDIVAGSTYTLKVEK